ncbi:MAG: Gfo/Idh/MocA family oxidoreductase, partial [Bacteroidota bacterium]|nr:Gfo/Idh/MocA family oxidoreductase [Bacteroidota bacterium]
MSTRRRFLQQSTQLVGGAAILSAVNTPAFAILKRRFSPAEQVNIGAIGIKGMGWSNVTAALKQPGVNLVALCDVDQTVLTERMAELAKSNAATTNIKTYTDYRKLLEQKDIDAIIIGTPDHWHALMM